MKVLCTGVIMFKLPEDFEGTISDGFRLLADYIDETEGKEEIHQDINLSRSYEDIISEVREGLRNDNKHKLRTIGMHINSI